MIKVENLIKTYDRGTRHANRVLHGMSLNLPDTGFVCILGPSGCGKTSLLNAIGGLDSFDGGKIITERAEITRSPSRDMERERNESFGYIFQNYYLLSEHSAAYNVFIGMHSMPLSKKEKMERVKDALSRVDMLRYRKRPVGQLSGGQQQRIAIARAIARKPRVIFADEPTGNLDEANTMNICTILKELSRESLVVMVTHEERIARFFADRIITLEGGKIVNDTTDWSRGTIDAGVKDAIYSGDYTESSISSEEISLRLLTANDAEPVSLTVVTEADRIIIKVSDPRVVLCSESSVAPRLIEGSRPILDADSFVEDKINTSEAEKEKLTEQKKVKKGLSLGLLFSEARSLVSGKKLRKFSTGLFIILLSLMIALSVADIVTVAHIDPEDFIITDSRILDFEFKRGPMMDASVWSLNEYISEYMLFLDESGIDFDYLPKSGVALKYRDSTVPQLGNLSMNFGGYSYVNISRFDESTLICGRMPERYDEIVVDRWVIEKALEEDGIIQNVIPNIEYLLGKQLKFDKKTFSPTIVGICDSKEPDIYMSQEAILSIGVGGTEVITLSEYRALTGYEDIKSLATDECIVLTDNAGFGYFSQVGGVYSSASRYIFKIKGALQNTDDSITAKFIIADDALPILYRAMIESSDGFSIWCSDKEGIYERLENDIPENIRGRLDIGVADKYQTAYSEYRAQTLEKVDARTIVTVTILALSFIMLYLMQRSKIKERMDLVAVYRLLGIPKKNLMLIFATESIILTLKYSIPTVLVTWLVIKILSMIEMIGLVMIYPFWAVGVTLLSIAVVRLLIAVLPVLRLLSQPPAKLAAKYDF